MADCKTCELMVKRDSGEAPLWDSIVRTPGWDLVHSYDTSLEGWLVLVARRHITSLAEMTDAEAGELGPLVKRVSVALEQVTGCEKTYLAQFAEHPDHPHVHVHLVPRAGDHPIEARGPKVFSLMGMAAEARVPEHRMNEIGRQVRRALEGTATG